VKVPISADRVAALLAKSNPHIIQATQPKPTPKPKSKFKPRKIGDRVMLSAWIPVGMMDPLLDHMNKTKAKSMQSALRQIIADAVGFPWVEKQEACDGRPGKSQDAARLRDEVAERYCNGQSLKDIAIELGISVSYASMLRRGQR